MVGKCAFLEPGRGDCVVVDETKTMLTFILWCLLFVVSWPLALLVLLLYPVIWLLLLPFRLVGVAVGGVLHLIAAILFLPVRLVRAIA
jgi:hypothetical protein